MTTTLVKKIGNLWWNVRQFPIVVSWFFLIGLAHKRKKGSFTICDISPEESSSRKIFIQMVVDALENLKKTSEKLHIRSQYFVRYIAHANIPNEFQYYSSVRLLLIRMKSEQDYTQACQEVAENLAEAATLGYLRDKSIDMLKNKERVVNLLNKQARMLEKLRDRRGWH